MGTSNMGTSDFSKILTELRKKNGISQKTAAKDLQVSQALLSHYEKGIRECGLDFVVKAANYYKVSCDYLLGNNNSSVSFDIMRITSDIPEDDQLSFSTIYRATGIIWAKMINNDENKNVNKDLLHYLYAIYDYIILITAVEKGYISKNWLAVDENIQLKSEIMLLLSKKLVDKIPENKKPVSDEVPKCVETFVKFINEYLNVNLAELIV